MLAARGPRVSQLFSILDLVPYDYHDSEKTPVCRLALPTKNKNTLMDCKFAHEYNGRSILDAMLEECGISCASKRFYERRRVHIGGVNSFSGVPTVVSIFVDSKASLSIVRSTVPTEAMIMDEVLTTRRWTHTDTV